MESAVVIVGMCRSGTSSVAGALANLGVYFGEKDQLYSEDPNNPKGYWEHKRLNASIRNFHLSLNLAGLDLDPMPEDWRDRPMSGEMVGRVASILKETFDERPVCGWKDPEASTLLPFVEEVLNQVCRRPVIVICVRNPLDVAVSQKMRAGTPEAQTMSAWALSTLAALRDSRGSERSVILFEDLLADASRSLAPIAESLKLGPIPNAQSWIRPELAHHETGPEKLQGFFKDAYELAAEAARAPERFSEGGFADHVDSLWSRWLHGHDLFSRPRVPEARFGASWREHGKRQVVEFPYRPTRTWQTLRASIPAPPDTRVSLRIYPLPAIVWIRGASWGEEQTRVLAGRHGQLDEHNGFQRVWLYHGSEQIAIQTPASPGPHELSLDVLIENNTVVDGMTFQDLSQRAIERGAGR